MAVDVSSLHRDAPRHALPGLLLPVIKNRQYVVVTEQGRPFFLSRAWLSEEAEARYLTPPAIHMPESDWTAVIGYVGEGLNCTL